MVNNGCTHITINTTRINLRFGLPANKEIGELLLSENSEKYLKGNEFTEAGLAKLLQAGYKNACLVDEIEEELKFSAFMDYVEGCLLGDEISELFEVTKIFAESRATKKLLSVSAEMAEENKKKLIGTTLNPLPITNSALPKNKSGAVRLENSSLKKKVGSGSRKKKKRS